MLRSPANGLTDMTRAEHIAETERKLAALPQRDRKNRGVLTARLLSLKTRALQVETGFKKRRRKV